MKNYFLDANAHLPINQIALKKYVEFSNSHAGHGHPSAIASTGRLAGGALEEARSKIANLIGADSASQIIFTSSCTQACEWGLSIFKEKYFSVNENNIGHPESQFYYNPIEHPAVSDNLEEQPCIKKMDLDRDGKILTEFTELDYLVCTGVHNELGIIYPIKNFNRKYIFADLSQSLGKIPVNVKNLNVDIAVFGAHKFGGPGGVGFLYLKDLDWWKPFEKGSRYFMDRPGTMDVTGIVSTATALEVAINSLAFRQEKMLSFQKTLEIGLEEFGFEIIGKYQPRVWNTTYAYAPGKAIQILMELDKEGIFIGLGSACGALHTGASKTIRELNRPGTNHDYLRISQWGDYDSKDAEFILGKIRKVIR